MEEKEGEGWMTFVEIGCKAVLLFSLINGFIYRVASIDYYSSLFHFPPLFLSPSLLYHFTIIVIIVIVIII